ncbi:MAG TPA: hypothetical protein VF590_23060, partial [Isosphaeraceae bacterium]
PSEKVQALLKRHGVQKPAPGEPWELPEEPVAVAPGLTAPVTAPGAPAAPGLTASLGTAGEPAAVPPAPAPPTATP